MPTLTHLFFQYLTTCSSIFQAENAHPTMPERATQANSNLISGLVWWDGYLRGRLCAVPGPDRIGRTITEPDQPDRLGPQPKPNGMLAGWLPGAGFLAAAP